MIGYVILIAIAIALSSAVFFYLKLYLPPDKPKCYENIDLTIDSIACVSGPTPPGGGNPASALVLVNFSNKGLFSLDAAYIKFGEDDRTFRTILNDPPDLELMRSNCNAQDPELKPGALFCNSYNYSSPVSLTTIYELSVEPLIWIDNNPVLCPESIVRERVFCV